MSLGVSQILAVSFPAVKTEMLNGFEWVSPKLRKLYANGRLSIKSLGAVVVDQYTGNEYNVSEVSVPIVWSFANESSGSERHKINFVSRLIRTAINDMDRILIEKIGNGSAVVSRQYRYDLGCTQQFSNGYVAKLFTAIAFID